MPRFVLAVALSLLVTASAAAEPATTIRNNGSPANRVDLVVLGDGYTPADIASGKYAADVQSIISAFFAQEPFLEYQNYFNVHRIDVTSIDSGADHPSRGVSRDTALDATYDCAGITRLICVNVTKVNTVLTASIPSAAARDVILVLVNDPEYGGSGGSVAVSSLHGAAVEIVLHELGHSLGQLADEYGGPPPPACNNTVEPSAVNATMQTARELIKWNHWIDPATPIPTGGTANGIPGLFQGVAYCDVGLYRPVYNSKMRSLGVPFLQINSEQLVRRFYNWVSPIDQATPGETSVIVRQGAPQRFTVTTPQPWSHALNIVWRLNGAVVSVAPEYVASSSMPAGVHRLELEVSDPTPLVRRDPASVLRATRSWTVVVIGGSVGDFDGDGTTEIGIFRPSNSTWYIRHTATGLGLTLTFGGPGDIPVVGDYDGDSHTDIAIFRPSTGSWYIRYTATGVVTSLVWGGTGDIPVQGDYDADGRTDIAVFRPSTGTWYVRFTATGAGITVVWGGVGDIPVPGDYDADGRADIAVFRPSSGSWYIRYTATGVGITLVWGGMGDIPVQQDYDGDGRTDIAIFRSSTGQWFVRFTATGLGITLVWGGGTDTPVSGDYDGDGRADIAVFRPSSSTWYIRHTANGLGFSVVWGGAGDIPLPARPQVSP